MRDKLRKLCPLPGRRERKKLEVRDRIRASALELFREKGYEATTVEEIAERADVAKGTFFNYFPRKDSLLVVLAEDMLERMYEELGDPATWTGTLREQLQRYFRWLVAFVDRDPELTKVMMIENMRTFWLRQEIDPVEMEWGELLPGMLKRALARGELPSTTNVAITARLLEAAQVFTTVNWLKAGGTLAQHDRELTEKIDIILRGVGASVPPRGETQV